MVSIKFSRKSLSALLAEELDDEQLAELLIQAKCSVEKMGEEIQLEITGDRPDLLAVQGVARALNGLLNADKGMPELKLGKQEGELFVEESILPIRPIVVGAFVKGIAFNDESIKEAMEVQEKLTLTHGRKRKKVAIGLHDSSKLKPPFHYRCVGPEGVKFIPLNYTSEMTPSQIMEGHEKGKEYKWILDGKHFPLIVDSADQVLSLPPVINGALTALSESTTNVFIDITGMDFRACNTALSILCHNFSDSGASIHPLKVVYPKNDLKLRTVITPIIEAEKMRLSVKEVNRQLGTDFGVKKITECLQRQRISAKASGNVINCEIPSYRTDFMHPIDLVEEVALGYGYNNFIPQAPRVFTKGSKSEQTVFVERVRDLMVGAGFLELSTYVLTSRKRMEKHGHSGWEAIELENPVSAEYSSVRSSLMPSLLEVLSENTHAEYPQRIFEIGEVVIKQPSHHSGTHTKTMLHLSAAIAEKESNLSETSSILFEVMRALGKRVSFKESYLRKYIQGRAANVLLLRDLQSKSIGVCGELSPELLEEIGLQMPVSVFEIELMEVNEIE